MINVYLRASTTEQDATRAKNAVDEFLSGYGKSADDYFIENASGSKLERPELGKLLHSAQEGDVIVVEQVDRLTRLSANDWETLKGLISSKGISLVSIDLPTSHAALTQSNDESLTGAILSTVNNMLLDILAITARKDYEDRRRRQAEGIEKAKAEGKFKGRQASPSTVSKCVEALDLISKGVSKAKAASLVGVGVATLYRYIEKTKQQEAS